MGNEGHEKHNSIRAPAQCAPVFRRRGASARINEQRYVARNLAFLLQPFRSRSHALAVEGFEAAVDRACACVEAGVDMIFPEAITDLGMYKKFAEAVKVPILANITEFGKTPYCTVAELASADVAMVLYPRSAR